MKALAPLGGEGWVRGSADEGEGADLLPTRNPGEPYMLLVYAKNRQEDLTLTQLRLLRRLVREEFR